MLTLLNIPAFSDVTSNSSDYAQGMFSELVPFAYVTIAITVAVTLLWLLRRAIVWGIHKLANHRQKSAYAWGGHMDHGYMDEDE